ncbi:hypothetical protein, conserved [Eimeria praecox]|uniref:Uncharacterized protein n=1 Tax=Eimeria praecox TaxID=51316 RepID=U6GZ43_9EIME|nr:hypothetical protein, conserved [Eimeria praecox]
MSTTNGEKQSSKELPEDVQSRMLADAAAFEKQHRQRVKEFKRQKFIKAKKALYSKLKFYELKKVQRRLQQTRRELLELMSQQKKSSDSACATSNGSVSSAAAGGEGLDERIAEAQRRLRLHLDDLNYIRISPNPLRCDYACLSQLVDSRKGDEANSEEEGGGDDMFVDAPEAAEETAAADSDPFEGAQGLSDEEAEQTGRKTEQGHGGKKPHTKNMGRPHDSRRAGEAVAAARHKKGAQRARGGVKPVHNSRNGFNSNWKKSCSPGQKQFPTESASKQHSNTTGMRRSNATKRQTPRQTQQSKQKDYSAAEDTKNQPARIGLSKHKAANQHLIFNSDEE